MKNQCASCGKCCSHVTVEIDKPETKEDYEEVRWFTLHENVMVYIDDEGDWYIEFRTRCKALDEENRCDIYDKRPTICRKYDADDCEQHGEGNYYEIKFTKPSEVEAYMQLKGIQ